MVRFAVDAPVMPNPGLRFSYSAPSTFPALLADGPAFPTLPADGPAFSTLPADGPAFPALPAEGPALPALASELPARPSNPWRGRRVREAAGPWGSDADVDALEELEHEIAVLAAHLQAGEQRLLEKIAEFDRRRGWELGGHRDCAEWLAVRTGMGLGAAREKVRVARALADLPAMRESMAKGELSFCAARALTRVATPANEAELLEASRGCTVASLERMVRAFRHTSRKDEAALEREQWESRTFSVFPGDDGMYVVRGRLPPEVGALLMKAIEAASDALYRERPNPLQPEKDTRKAAAQRRADAVGLLSERALAAGFGGGSDGRGPGGDAGMSDRRGPGEDAGSLDGQGAGEDALPVPVSGSRAERYQVVLHVDMDTLSGGSGSGSGYDAPIGRSELEDGVRVSCETARRLACDVAVVSMMHGADGSIIDVGRRTRTISPALRRALNARDRGCRFPDHSPAASGARECRFTDAHHVIHWADGGETSLENCLLLCHHHHRLVHEGAWKVDWWGAGRPVFTGPRGGLHFEGGWEPPALPEAPVAALLEQNRLRGVDPDGWATCARWDHHGQVPRKVELRFAEAVDEG